MPTCEDLEGKAVASKPYLEEHREERWRLRALEGAAGRTADGSSPAFLVDLDLVFGRVLCLGPGANTLPQDVRTAKVVLGRPV